MFSRDFYHKQAGLGSMGVLFLLVVISGFVFVWFQYISPVLIEQKIRLANHKFEYNKFDEAKEIYQKILPKTKGSQQVMVQDRIAQLPLAEQYIAKEAPEIPSIKLGVIEVLTAKMSLMYIHFKLKNFSDVPIPVRRSLFYLKSMIGACEVALDRPQNTEVSVADGIIEPGEQVEGGICVKYMLSGEETIYLVYNNGSAYVNCKIPLSRMWAQTDKDEFEKPGWNGKIGEAEGIIRKQKEKQEPQAAGSGEKKEVEETTSSEPKSPFLKQPFKKKPVRKTGNVTTKKETLKQKPGFFTSSRYNFSLKPPSAWKKVNDSAFSADSFARLLPGSVVFQGPVWKGRFPLLIIQKVSNGYGGSISINNETLNDMEKDLRRILDHSTIKIRRLQSRMTLIGNIKVGEVDLEFSFNSERFQMKSFVLEGSTGFLLSYICAEEDFNVHVNQAIQSIRTFRSKD